MVRCGALGSSVVRCGAERCGVVRCVGETCICVCLSMCMCPWMCERTSVCAWCPFCVCALAHARVGLSVEWKVWWLGSVALVCEATTMDMPYRIGFVVQEGCCKFAFEVIAELHVHDDC